MAAHDETVEKVARAIYEVMPHYDLDQGFAVMSWDDLVAFEEGAGYTPTITVLRDKARAAIAAMSPQEDGLEELRALSEKATPGYWSAAPAIPGATQMFYLSGNHDANNREVDIGTIQGGAKSCEANARLIVACVNHVRAELERKKD